MPVFRFAPSPNGDLHLGHAYSALLNAEMARAAGGRFLVRIEDIDTARCKPEFAARALDDLRWLGLAWEEPVRYQSRHTGDYLDALARLRAMGRAYRCVCTRGDLARGAGRKDPEGQPVYPGTCRHSPPPPGPAALRLADGPSAWGDVVIGRRDIGVSYHVAVVVDDALQGVTHVVRGEDIEAQTVIHRMLQDLLGLPAPEYVHHGLINDAAGRKLSKSAGSTSLRSLRAAGAVPEDIRRTLGFT